jgi:hypothetical protein
MQCKLIHDGLNSAMDAAPVPGLNWRYIFQNPLLADGSTNTMLTKIMSNAAVLLAFASLSTGLLAKEELPEFTEDGLQRVHDSKMAAAYAQPGANLSGYTEVILLDAQVSFRKNWERDQRSSSLTGRLSSKDIEGIKTRLATEFNVVFSKTLTEGGYPVVTEAGDNVLLIRPAIINLDVNAPDKMTAGRSRTYTSTAGEMTLYVEVYDSVTGDLIAKALDRKQDYDQNFYTWTNSVTNKAAADRILKIWANILLQALNEARNGKGSDQLAEPSEE